MGESWNFTQQGGGAGGGEVSPGSGSSGFTSAALVFGDSVGRLTNNSSTPTWDSTANILRLSPTTGAKIEFVPGSSVMIRCPTTNQFQFNVPDGGVHAFRFGNAANAMSITTAVVQIGSSASSVMISLPSTINATTAVGTSGAAAAPPANPEVYLKIRAPNAAGTFTTLYIPAYLST